MANMTQPFTNIINELKEQVSQSRQDLITLLEESSPDYTRMRELLEKYAEALSASELLGEAGTEESDADEVALIPDEKSPWVEEDALLESTVVSKHHLKLVGSETANKIELRLAVLDSKGQVTEIEVSPEEGERLIIGRTRAKPIPDVGLMIDDKGISSKHCEINWTQEKGWVLVDFGTTNGTKLNGVPIVGELHMAKFGEIHLGDSVIKFYPKDQQTKLMGTTKVAAEG